jgi:toxin FitB
LFLLDTNVISETGKNKPHGGVLAWIASVPPASLFISAMTVGEIQAGAELTREQDDVRADAIEAWLWEMVSKTQVIAMDTEIAILWAKLMRGRWRSLAEDSWIAATALHHDLVVVTRNIRDFEGLGVQVMNPFLDTRSGG